MPNKPFISIIIPMYNVEKYIARALESCINQTFGNIEIIIIDDCGTDNSAEIAKTYALKDNRIQIIHNDVNMGLFKSRMIGENNAQGEYILHLDSDDYIDINTCDILHQTILDCSLEKNTNNRCKMDKDTKRFPDIVFFGMHFYPKTIKRISPPILTQTLYDDEILKATFVNRATPPWHMWGKLYKTSHIKHVINLLKEHMGDFPRLNMAEDVLKSFAIMALAHKSIGIKDKLYIYCNNANSITRKTDLDSTQKKIRDFNNVISYIDRFSHIKEIGENKNYYISKTKTQNILKAQIELEYRYLNPDELKIMMRGGGSPKCYLTP